MVKKLVMIALVATCLGAVAGELPPLVGDGVADDTAAIQARIDTGRSCVYLPPPAKEYVISKTLLLGSGQELRLDRFTRVRLAKGSSCLMLSNRHREEGDRRVALTGGIWDFDNVNQAPNPQQAHLCKPPVKVVMPRRYDPNFYLGILMSFRNVRDLQVRHVTFRNPGQYSCQLAGVSDFRVDDITFDFDKWHPIRLNMDGIHLDGDCHHGRITDLNGTCFDDLVAINANDGSCAPVEAPITDIEVDGIHAEYCHSAVRILSAGAEVRRIAIRNVFGNFYTYVFKRGDTYYFTHSGGSGRTRAYARRHERRRRADGPLELPRLHQRRLLGQGADARGAEGLHRLPAGASRREAARRRVQLHPLGEGRRQVHPRRDRDLRGVRLGLVLPRLPRVAAVGRRVRP